MPAMIIDANDPRMLVVLKAYADMGRPEITSDDAGAQAWAAQGASAQDIWYAASLYINDPQYTQIAQNAIALLKAHPAPLKSGLVSMLAQNWADAGVNPVTGATGNPADIAATVKSAVQSVLDTVTQATGNVKSGELPSYALPLAGLWIAYKLLK